ncbi:MAG TPA: AAA family ATPase, partial [Oligella sp.]|nr:AAA family ATPase [Oligella sp.]
NLNPKLIKLIAKVIYSLAANGVQVFIATHSLFLLRELEIIAANENDTRFTQRYFSLNPEGGSVIIEQGNELADLQTLVMLDETLQQSDRYMELE